MKTNKLILLGLICLTVAMPTTAQNRNEKKARTERAVKKLSTTSFFHRLQTPLPALPHREYPQLDIANRCRATCGNRHHRRPPRFPTKGRKVGDKRTANPARILE